MARLRCDSRAERALVPAFVWFFRCCTRSPRVNRPGRTAAAAGGVMLVDRAALAAAGGIAAIRGALIDDCALGALLKRQGPIRLVLTDRSESLRPYPRIGDVGAMIARSAYAQLGYSPLLLAGTLLGLAADLRRAAAAGAVRRRLGAARRRRRLGDDGGRVPADAALLPPLAAVGRGAAGDRRYLRLVHAGVGGPVSPRPRRQVEGSRPGGRRSAHDRTRTATTENFPVASWLLKPAARAPIMAFYRFARAADDIADDGAAIPRREAGAARRDARDVARARPRPSPPRWRCAR